MPGGTLLSSKDESRHIWQVTFGGGGLSMMKVILGQGMKDSAESWRGWGCSHGGRRDLPLVMSLQSRRRSLSVVRGLSAVLWDRR
jgi:hypothetical protein